MTTAQSLFDTVAAHLTSMPGQSADELGACMYRTTDGNRCAVGCVITDEEYDPTMEGATVYHLQLPQRLVPHLDLLGDLQQTHDSRYNWNGPHFIGHQNLRFIAEKHGLTCNV